MKYVMLSSFALKKSLNDKITYQLTSWCFHVCGNYEVSSCKNDFYRDQSEIKLFFVTIISLRKFKGAVCFSGNS